MRALPYGEDGVYVDLEAGEAEDRAARTHALAASLRAAHPAADVVAGAGVVAVFGLGPRERAALLAAPPGAPPDVYTSSAPVCTHRVDVVYDGPDLDDVAARAGVSRAGVIDLHAGRDHVVELVGFLPGFAYMGPIDPRLVAPRRAAPRPRVAAGSVAIAGAYTGIYPLDSPGGWNLLGRSLGPAPFDPSREAPFLFAPGDRVRFRPAPEGEARLARASAAASGGVRAGAAASGDVRASGDAPASAAARAADDARPALVIARAAGIATVQDAGRHGLLGRGMPPSGPLDPALFAAANRAAGNPPGAAAIELLAGSLLVRARGAVALSVDGAPARLLAAGEEARIGEGPGAVRYVAVSGGVGVPVVLGARATLLSAGIGGVSGRPLRPGDALPIGAAPSAPAVAVPVPVAASSPAAPLDEALASTAPAAPDTPIQIDPGPHLDRFPAAALDVLLASGWRASRLRDRTGLRLEGARVPRLGPDLAAPVPMRRGAVQITTDGTPIVLGPDHPTTGGYPVLAVVRPASFAALAQRRPGDPVRFTLARP